MLYWDITKPQSYNCLFNFIVGMRGVGKTFGFKEWAIRDFIKTGGQFAYIRRFTKELQEKKINGFFDDIIKENKFPGHEFAVKNKNFYIDGKLAGFTFCLATSKIDKSMSFPDVTKICFDEFILDKGVHHYLPDEITGFLELYETIARLRSVPCWFLSNALTISNPYFHYFDLTVPYGKEIKASDDILIQVIKKSEYVEAKKQTRFGKIIENTAYGRYAVENEFLRDNKNFIGKKTANADYYFTLKYNGDSYGIFVDYKQGLMFISESVDPSQMLIFAVTNDDHEPNTLLIKGRKSHQVKMLIEMYRAGAVRFESIKIKNAINAAMKYFPGF